MNKIMQIYLNATSDMNILVIIKTQIKLLTREKFRELFKQTMQ